jgi:hypothetical protein
MSLPNLSRRSFLSTAAPGIAACASLANASLAHAALPATEKAGAFPEQARELPLTADADVIVCGAGPAGVTAAITAARSGARVRLFEAHGSLGGVWTSSLLGHLLDFDKKGFTTELVTRLRERDAIVAHDRTRDALNYHPEEMKLLLEELCLSAGVTVQMHTRVAAAYREGRQLKTIVTESKSGRQAWRAPVFIDTTGDGDLGAQAGCEFEIGERKACPCQPLTMMALLLVKDAKQLNGMAHGLKGPNRSFLSELRRAGLTPSYGAPILLHLRGNLLAAMLNHEYGIHAADAAAVTTATMRARAELHRLVRGLSRLGGVWEGLQIVATPEQIGIRDGRRIRGRYVVEREDLVTGARHEDAVTRATYIVDVHALSSEQNKKVAWSDSGVKTKPYDIPLRALLASDVDGLMMAGRCISGDFIAHASYRVTGNAVAMGEAAGAVAAVAARSKRPPHDVPWSEGHAALMASREQA